MLHRSPRAYKSHSFATKPTPTSAMFSPPASSPFEDPHPFIRILTLLAKLDPNPFSNCARKVLASSLKGGFTLPGKEPAAVS